ncbi:MAG TPA: hypothetical protein ENG40_00860 [Thermoprotei archaeon]|nr:hypothetical protein [Thermoprotei archaeon]
MEILIIRGSFKSAILNVLEIPFDFNLSVSPSSKNVYQGESVSFTVSITLISGNSRNIYLSLSNVSSGISYTFNPSSGRPPFTSTLTIHVSENTNPQKYILNVLAKNSVREKYFNIELNVIKKEGSPTSEDFIMEVIFYIIPIVFIVIVSIILLIIFTRKRKEEETRIYEEGEETVFYGD